jgi:hypothetical protein
MACEIGAKSVVDPAKVDLSGKVDFYRDTMLPQYWKANAKADEEWGLKPMTFVDDVSYTKKLRIRLNISPDTRFMPGEYWVAAIRRACYMGYIKIGKRAIRIASDVHGFKPWVAGTDYVELGLQQDEMKPIPELLRLLNENAPSGLTFVDAKMVRREADLKTAKDLMGLFKYELDCTVDEAKGRLRLLQSAATFNMKREEYRAGITTVTMNTREWLLDAWLTREGSGLQLFMLMSYGEPLPYNIIGSVFHWSEPETRANVCSLVDLFAVPSKVADFFAPPCVECGEAIPMTVLDKLHDQSLCLKCSSLVAGTLIFGEKLYANNIVQSRA